MSYTKALYYPTIDVEDSEWMKTAILFWDEINTIVPESISAPYKNNDSRFLYDEGILRPILLSPNDSVFQNFDQKIFKFSETREALDFLHGGSCVENNPYGDSRAEFYLHRDKLPLMLQEHLMENMLVDDYGWVKVSDNFANYYMTLLATTLAKRKHRCLITDTNAPYELSTSYSLGKISSAKQKIAEGILFKMVVNGIKISRTESLKDLLEYKRKRKDELGRFRSALASLTDQQNYDDIDSVEELEEKVRCIYENDYLPALHGLKETLNDSKISWMDKLGNYMTTLFAPSLVMDNVNVLSSGIGLGISLLNWKISEYLNIRKVKYTNSYSYMLSLESDGKLEYK